MIRVKQTHVAISRPTVRDIVRHAARTSVATVASPSHPTRSSTESARAALSAGASIVDGLR